MSEVELLLGGFDGNEREILHDVFKKNGNNFYGLLGGVFTQIEREIGDVVTSVIGETDFSQFSCMNVGVYVKSVVDSVKNVLSNKEILHPKFLNGDFSSSLGYRAYVIWVIKLLENAKKRGKSTFDIHSHRYKDVDNKLGQEIKNIFQDNALTTLFMVMTSYGVLHSTKNPVNTFEEEKELKILEIDRDNVIAQLVELGSRVVFAGEIVDQYYDTPDLKFDRIGKRSLRIRRKVNVKSGDESQYYTIKRKKDLPNSNAISRTCYEKEFEILALGDFQHILTYFGLKASRVKRKERVSLELLWRGKIIKFDIDDYEGIPTILEIESEDEKTIEEFMEILRISKNKTLSTGSRGVYRYYGMEEKYIKFYEEKKGFIHWNDGTKFIVANKEPCLKKK